MIRNIIQLILIALTVNVVLSTHLLAQDTSYNFIAEISKNPDVVDQIGLNKLNQQEKEKLNELLNIIFNLGFQSANEEEAQKFQGSKPPESSFREEKPETKRKTINIAYKTKIDSDDGDILKLDNGAIVEISSGYLGYVGYRKDAVLYKIGSNWKIWIEGKKSFKCSVYKYPSYGTAYSVEEKYISEVKGDGSILVMSDGSIYEVGSIYTISTSLWLGTSEALLINDNELLNLDEGDEIIEVTKIK